MPLVLDAIYLAALVLLSPWLIYRALATGKRPSGFWQKLIGIAPEPDRTTLPLSGTQLRLSPLGGRGQGEGVHSAAGPTARPRAWFHGVSVGEIHLLRQVVQQFQLRHPDWECVISTTTSTGFQEAGKAFMDLRIFYWPFDFSWAVGRALDRVRPTLIVLAESELWPSFLLAATKRNLPIALINARMSPRTCRNYESLRSLARRLFSRLDLVAAQSNEYASFFLRLGVSAHRIVVTGSVKYDGVSLNGTASKTSELAKLFQLDGESPLLIAGSTQAPEEQIITAIFRGLRARHPLLRLVIVPRQRERFDEVAALLARSQMPFLRRSQLQTPAAAPIVLLDTIGELGALWPLATIGFVGGSLDGKRGGQNMIEPAAAGVPTVFGPHVWNFRDTANRLIAAGGALEVQDSAALEIVLERWLNDSAVRRQAGAAAKNFVESQRGACQRTLDALDRLIDNRLSRQHAA